MNEFMKGASTNSEESLTMPEICQMFSDALKDLVKDPTKDTVERVRAIHELYEKKMDELPGEVVGRIGFSQTQLSMQYHQLMGYADTNPSLFCNLGSMIAGMMCDCLKTISRVTKD